MALFWRDELATGIAEVDQQHKELFNRINMLLDACKQGKGRQEVEKVLKFLEEYVVTHFTAEEKLHQQHGFPNALDHKNEHTLFVKEFNELKKKFDTEGATITFVGLVNRKVVDWITRHIEQMDKAFGDFLKNKK